MSKSTIVGQGLLAALLRNMGLLYYSVVTVSVIESQSRINSYFFKVVYQIRIRNYRQS